MHTTRPQCSTRTTGVSDVDLTTSPLPNYGVSTSDGQSHDRGVIVVLECNWVVRSNQAMR
jgi:ribosome biogenesis protein Tsr3